MASSKARASGMAARLKSLLALMRLESKHMGRVCMTQKSVKGHVRPVHPWPGSVREKELPLVRCQRAVKLNAIAIIGEKMLVEAVAHKCLMFWYAVYASSSSFSSCITLPGMGLLC